MQALTGPVSSFHHQHTPEHTVNLNKAFNAEIKAVKSMKERGVIQDYRSNEKTGIVWIKVEGEWIEVWNVEDALDFNKPFNGA